MSAAIEKDANHGRRQHPRREFPRGIGVLTGSIYGVDDGLEIGEGGISFWRTEALEIGAFACVTFQVPRGSCVSVIVEVRSATHDPSAEKFRVGCVFTDIKFEHKREIRAYVSARA